MYQIVNRLVIDLVEIMEIFETSPIYISIAWIKDHVKISGFQIRVKPCISMYLGTSFKFLTSEEGRENILTKCAPAGGGGDTSD